MEKSIADSSTGHYSCQPSGQQRACSQASKQRQVVLVTGISAQACDVCSKLRPLEQAPSAAYGNASTQPAWCTRRAKVVMQDRTWAASQAPDHGGAPVGDPAQ